MKSFIIIFSALVVISLLAICYFFPSLLIITILLVILRLGFDFLEGKLKTPIARKALSFFETFLVFSGIISLFVFLVSRSEQRTLDNISKIVESVMFKSPLYGTTPQFFFFSSLVLILGFAILMLIKRFMKKTFSTKKIANKKYFWYEVTT